ncbi:conserved membrane hypothetical protein [Candidatus Zixiibacteriota bacterium]|nr:conserved membrane hypothetical protein [candidate division Zixibacteria bacterium]
MSQSSDHAQIAANPFLICGGCLIAGLLLQLAIALPFLPLQSAHILGVIIFFTGFVFGLPSLVRFRRAKTTVNPYRTTTSFVSTGPYRYSRNPIYVAMILNYIGLAVLFNRLWAVILVPVVIWLLTLWVIIPEEKYLETKFGDEYCRYKSRVRRWL